MSKKEVQRWADIAMYRAEPNAMTDSGETEITPFVHLVSMTPKPLQTMAAAAQLYAGKLAWNPGTVDRDIAMEWWRDMSLTVLKAPLEFIDLHFFFEGVTRAFTHQLVRQRTAVYIQESQRFAVKEDAAWEVAYPPSLMGKPDDFPWKVRWDKAVQFICDTYNALVSDGMPAEDARGLLPTNITTRVHYKTNLRNLAEHAGMRLCSQAQFEWKAVWAGILDAILEYGPEEDRWQQLAIARLFRPVCYRTGKCEFMAATDRACAIRGRVEEHHERGDHPETWDDIDPREALMEGAARVAPGNIFLVSKNGDRK